MGHRVAVMHPAGIAAALDRHLWDASLGRYRRAVNVARADGTGAPIRSAFDRSLAYPNRRVGSVDASDTRLDSALLGLAWAFAPFGGDAERVRATVEAVEHGLATPDGALRRHDDDTYGGGYEWPLATLWLGLARRALGDGQATARALAQVVGRRTPLDLLPEQVRSDVTPAWVLPLGWSHALPPARGGPTGARADRQAARRGCRRRPRGMTAAGLPQG